MSSAALPLPSELRLVCLPVWRVETKQDSSFHVDIGLRDEKGFPTTIAHLKREIKPHIIDHDVTFDSLSLYKVSILLDDEAPVGSLSKKVEENKKRTQALSNPKLIENVFPTQPNFDEYHILVDIPGRLIPEITFKLWCILYPTGVIRDDAFPVAINGNADVHSLKQAVKEGIPNTLGHLDPHVLTLFDVSSLSIMMDDSFDEHIKSVDLGSVQRLNPAELISRIFGVVNSDNRLHVIVRLPTEEPVPKVWEDSERRDTVAALDNRFQQVLDNIRKASSLSESAKSSGYPEAQKRYGICDGRNETAPGPPVELFHPVFAHFLNDVAQEKLAVTKDISRTVVDYMKAAAKSYTSEDKRRTELTKFLPDIIGQPIDSVFNNDNTRPDGMVRHQTHAACGPAVLLLKEDKNELGDGGSDPSTRVGLSYARTWAQNDYQKLRDISCCPSFLIANGGPWITILGAVFSDRPIVQRLTDYIWVGVDTALHNRLIPRVARTFFALKRGLERLKDYYSSLQPLLYQSTSTSSLRLPLRFFPSFTAYLDKEDNKVHFEYLGFLESDISCVTLRARTCREPHKDIVVKFVERYCREAHELLAQQRLAPELFYYGNPSLENGAPNYGELSMVIMEFITGETLLVAKNRVDRVEVKKQVERAIHLLHQADIVFGDLRQPNVMITKQNEVRLIDFNWAGKEGEAEYPNLISPAITWPPGVEPLSLMKKRHDLVMLDRLI